PRATHASGQRGPPPPQIAAIASAVSITCPSSATARSANPNRTRPMTSPTAHDPPAATAPAIPQPAAVQGNRNHPGTRGAIRGLAASLFAGRGGKSGMVPPKLELGASLTDRHQKNADPAAGFQRTRGWHPW